ncbi:unnamed protein product [Ranitomeya imitator]|uniref:Cytochrome P450 n=1 Tax=Ranitomeya imitator TaxID=111125 RepID=A0ABN9LIP9_9NEOB|nr:unnamed protein product [Ranitomeya imitator]
MQLAKEYGPVFSIQIGMSKSIVLCGYDTIKDALVNNADYFSERPDTPVFVETLKGYGVVFSNGENWKVMRRFAISTLRDYGMGRKTIEDKIIEETEYLIQKLKSYEGKPFDNVTGIYAAVTNIIVSILLSKRFDYEDPTILRLMGLVKQNIKLLASPWVMVISLEHMLGVEFLPLHRGNLGPSPLRSPIHLLLQWSLLSRDVDPSVSLSLTLCLELLLRFLLLPLKSVLGSGERTFLGLSPAFYILSMPRVRSLSGDRESHDQILQLRSL